MQNYAANSKKYNAKLTAKSAVNLTINELNI